MHWKGITPTLKPNKPASAILLEGDMEPARNLLLALVTIWPDASEYDWKIDNRHQILRFDPLQKIRISSAYKI